MIHYQDIQILRNKVNFIVGNSGSGKSTLLRLFNQTLSQSSGNILFAGKDIEEMNTIDLRKNIMLISQSVFLFDTTIRENFKLFYEYRGLNILEDANMQEYLAMCNIFFPLDKDCTSMSGGERQRVYIAIFLSFLPKVLMLDEPTSALDKENSNIVISNITGYCQKKEITVIIVSHDSMITETFAENLITIERRAI
ncbi:MAG: transporter related [Anaerocolumna sp.]|jgi:putative ABC transport system ATP-binding protein|nr:transporter related [Anaerocolumna sp.]